MNREFTYQYSVVENRHMGWSAIKLAEEPFAGIVFSYENVRVADDEEAGTIDISFDYFLHDTAGKQFGDNGPFEEYIGVLLQRILLAEIAIYNEKEQHEGT